MKNINFETLDDAIECYGRENLIAIDNLKQAIFYTKHGCQPKYVSEHEYKPGKVSFWFLKPETTYVYNMWQKENLKKQVDAKSGSDEE